MVIIAVGDDRVGVIGFSREADLNYSFIDATVGVLLPGCHSAQTATLRRNPARIPVERMRVCSSCIGPLSEAFCFRGSPAHLPGLGGVQRRTVREGNHG